VYRPPLLWGLLDLAHGQNVVQPQAHLPHFETELRFAHALLVLPSLFANCLGRSIDLPPGAGSRSSRRAQFPESRDQEREFLLADLGLAHESALPLLLRRNVLTRPSALVALSGGCPADGESLPKSRRWSINRFTTRILIPH
jgi:hypothetical protein